MKTAVIDFETYYDADISVVTLGTANYVAQAEAYIVGIAVDGEVHCGTLSEMRQMMDNIASDPTIQPAAANSGFDEAWWNKYTKPFTKEWYCVLDCGAFNQFPRNLAMLSSTVLGIKVDKALRDGMKGKHYEDLTPEEQVDMQNYCATDCIREAEVLEAMPPMTSFEDAVAKHTRKINKRGVYINTELLSSDKTKLEEMRHSAFKSIPWHRDEKPLSHPALVTYCNHIGVPAPKSTAKTSEECDDYMDAHPALAEVINNLRRFRKANTMLKKCETLGKRLTEDGRLPLDILYCGAPHTRRWSSKGFNVQNLDKEPLKTGVGDMSVWTRNWLIPKPGHVFLIADYAQIEPRCLNWMVDNQEMMAALRLGFSYYESYAVAAKGWKGNPGTLKKEFGPARYTKLKNECLGCGYGMGATKYMSYASVTEDEATAIVQGFRRTNPKVVSFWRRLDTLISAASKDKERRLDMELPTGETLKYFGVRGVKGGYEGFVTKGDFGALSRQPRLWGGTLTENLCQRMSRDLMAHAMLNIEAAGIPIRFHVHDEIVMEIPIIGKEEARDEAFRIMRQAPEWAADLPLDIEGDFAECYTK